MKLFLNIVTTMLLIPWPILIMMSPMLIAAPGAEKNKGNIVLLLLVLFYPVLFMLGFRLFDANFWGFAPDRALNLAALLSVAVGLLFQYPRFVFNALRGVAGVGYCITKSAVYFDGRRVKQARPASFEVLGEAYSFYGKDAAQVFYKGGGLAGANPATFEVVTNADGKGDARDGDKRYQSGKLIQS